MGKSNAGYSLFELVILIAILGIVCYFIFVNSESLSGQKPQEMEAIAAEMIRIGIHNYATMSKQMNRSPLFPVRLDSAEAGCVASDRSPLFTAIFPESGIRTAWKKLRENQYVYVPSTPDPVTENAIYFYDPTRGTFDKGKNNLQSQEARAAAASDCAA
jgi:type II secretory pathway pseudopilin PulG